MKNYPKTLWLKVEIVGQKEHGAEITKIAAIIEENGKEIAAMTTFVQPPAAADLSENDFKYLGRTEEDVYKRGKSPKHAYGDLLEFMQTGIDTNRANERMVIAGYNIRDDITMIENLFALNDDYELYSHIHEEALEVNTFIACARELNIIDVNDRTHNTLANMCRKFNATLEGKGILNELEQAKLLYKRLSNEIMKTKIVDRLL